ncbi:hypothetical protein BV25DRAFT_1839349 [Artomyces pyxidatus]|uniref:Uncharacterized protein n=1 Tax=Artomyces pyxidatus TaxID=48021 RepID=A0ACB8SYT2_9AGAM|nr:hypothetical protein BV25DRAFT_1839349 [Artomyces pyxidatus]
MNSSNPNSHAIANPGHAEPNAVLPRHLVQAAQEFSLWLQTVAPGARPFVCGGLALSIYGNPRSTTDADLAIDLSGTRRPGSHRPYDTNALKHLAAQDTQRFIVGPKIYWILNPGTPYQTPVQVDFVDAHLFWAPFEPLEMIDSSPNLPVPLLNVRTLLVSKMKSAIERSQPNAFERAQKQQNDVKDFFFALGVCLQMRTPLLVVQFRQLGHSEAAGLATVGAFWRLATQISASYAVGSIDMHKQMWAQLVLMSGAPAAFVNGV